MKYNISLAKDISRLCATCLGYLILFATVLSVYQKAIPEPYWLLGIPLILLCFQLIQNYCFQPILYIVLHGIIWIPAVVIPFSYMEYRYLFLFMLLYESARAIQVWKINAVKPYDDIPWFLFVSICFIYAIATAYQMDHFALLIYYLGLGVLILHFVQLFISGLTRLMTKSEQATSMPAKKILLTNTFIFIFFLIILIILTVTVKHSNIDSIFTALGQMIIKVIRFIIRLAIYISAIINALFAKDRQMEETAETQQDMENALEELQEPSLFAQILDGIIMIIVVFILAYMAYRAIVALIRVFSKRYAQDTDIVVPLSKPKEITKVPKQQDSVIKRIQEFFRTDNASKIRRGYRLKIKSYKPAIFKEQDTPAEIAARIEETYQENIQELTQVYEKARYSNEEITFDDVQKGGLL